MKLKPLSININPNNVEGYCLLYDIANYNTARQIYEWIDRTIPDDHSIGKKNKLDTYHITLNYIGPLSHNLLTALDEELDHFDFEPIPIKLDKVGYFDEAGVMYVGMKGKPPVALQNAFDKVNDILKSLGIESENNRFPTYKPHITVLHDCPSRPQFPTINRKFELVLLDATLTQSIVKYNAVNIGNDGKVFVPLKNYPKSWYKYDYEGNEMKVGGFITTGELLDRNQSPYLLDKVSKYARKSNIVTSKTEYKIITTPREREDGRRVTWNPKTLDDFDDIKMMDDEQRKEIGMQLWGELVKWKDGNFYSIFDCEGTDYIFTRIANGGDKERVEIESETLPKYNLWLFPKEWYNSIPDGLEVIDINGGKEEFKRHETDSDIRFGALAYGFVFKR